MCSGLSVKISNLNVCDSNVLLSFVHVVSMDTHSESNISFSIHLSPFGFSPFFLHDGSVCMCMLVCNSLPSVFLCMLIRN